MVAAALAAIPSEPILAQAERLRFDTPTTVNNVEVVCTGIGLSSRQDPRWGAYPLKVEVAGADGQYLGNVRIAFERAGQGVAELACGGPWILARLEPGSYSVTAAIDGASTSSSVNVPATGQARLILRFPEVGGAVSPEHEPSPGQEPENSVDVLPTTNS